MSELIEIVLGEFTFLGFGCMSKKLKILIVGPQKAAKSTLANVLGEVQTSNELTAPYFPTLGVRIVEAQIEGINAEFWEISGHVSFKQYWSVLADKANGSIFVFADGQADDLNAFIHSGVFPQKHALVIQTCTRSREPEVPKNLPFTPLRIFDDDVLAFKAVVHQWIRNYYTRNYFCFFY